MKKLFLALVMVALLLGVASAGAEKLNFDVISASCEIDSGYIVITPANMKNHPDWIANRGSTLEKLTERAQTDDALKQLLAETDVLVDGPFILAQRSLELDFCGSKNQRLIDMNETRRQGKIVLWTPPVW